jgi:hypothetical protein
VGFALCEGAVVKMAAKVYGDYSRTSFQNWRRGKQFCYFSLFDKGHDGFRKLSAWEWCNIGADSNNSNLKNNYEEVKLWSYETESFAKTGLQFCGLMMGDHSKCGINVQYRNCHRSECKYFWSGFPRNFVPSFSWGGAAGFTYITKKAFEARLVMGRRM